MSDNVASGYAGIGGERLWPSLPAYWGQVVQSWANPNHTVWNTFDAQIDEFGVPTAVWVMVCIFAQNGVTIDEMRDIVENVRERAPDATIYVTGQPLYTDGHVCSAAGATGPQLTDDMAQQVAEDPSLTNIEYGGTFILTPAGTEADTCHANAAGRESLGEQAADKWGL